GDTLLEIQKEENSFLPSQKKLDKLYGDLRLYNQLTKNAVAAQKGDKMMSPQEYMQALNQNIIINVDSNGKAVVETDKGKPPKVSGRKTTPGWGA
ncbi:MAG: hypothetical protein II892_12315, partial [Fibrobacter sp.]|nr:hypothetical protein [Fibrobacter sp.]